MILNNFFTTFTEQQAKLIHEKWSQLRKRSVNLEYIENSIVLSSEPEKLKIKIMEIISQSQKRLIESKIQGQFTLSIVTKIIKHFIRYQYNDARSQINQLQGQLMGNLFAFMNKYFFECICLEKGLKLPINKYLQTISTQGSKVQQINEDYSNLYSIQQEYFYLLNQQIIRMKNQCDKVHSLKNIQNQKQLMKLLKIENINDQINLKNYFKEGKDNLSLKLDKIKLILVELGQMQTNKQVQKQQGMTQKRIYQLEPTLRDPFIKIYQIIKDNHQNMQLYKTNQNKYNKELNEAIQNERFQNKKLKIQLQRLRNQRSSKLVSANKQISLQSKSKTDHCTTCQGLSLKISKQQQSLRVYSKQLVDYNDILKKNKANQLKIRMLNATLDMQKNQAADQKKIAQQTIQDSNLVKTRLTESIKDMRAKYNQASLQLLSSQNQNRGLLNRLRTQDTKLSNEQTIKALRINQNLQRRCFEELQKLLKQSKKENILLQSQLKSLKQQLQSAQSLQHQHQKGKQLVITNQNGEQLNSHIETFDLQNSQTISKNQLKAILNDNIQLKASIQQKTEIIQHIMKRFQEKQQQNQAKMAQLALKNIDLEQMTTNYANYNESQLLANERNLKRQIIDLKIQLGNANHQKILTSY